jgi:CDP-diacylglycerol--glycerol-3-phosphate 3-phosphatidyltransferase
MSAVKALPNVLTAVRILLGVGVFVCLVASVGEAIPALSEALTVEQQFALRGAAFWLFVVAASTDFIDGLAARKLDAVSAWGAILDPIADKILLAAAVLGLLAQGTQFAPIAIPSALILFREFFVSALRETTAAKGVKLPVTMLAKWKTTVQLIALALVLLVAAWPSFGLGMSPEEYEPVERVAYAAMWLAAILTVWTGVEYFRAADRQLRGT